MTPLSCGEVRAALAGIGEAAGAPVAPETWATLVARGAVSGDREAPAITPVGRHVLAELEARAARTDPLPLDLVAEELGRVLGQLDARAKTAEYFLAALGPLTPPAALPLLRPVAALLANLRQGPDDLAEGFRNIWGSVEVMGGDPRDRLLAAALLSASDAPIERIYSPLMATTQTLRARAGPTVPAVTVATILHLLPGPDGSPAVPAYLELRRSATTEEGAAILAASGRAVAELLTQRSEVLSQLDPTSAPSQDARVAAGFLAVTDRTSGPDLERLRSLSDGLRGRFAAPLTPAAILTGLNWLSPSELLNWWTKAVEIARARQLAPTPPELATLGLALLLGVAPSDLAGTPSVGPPSRLEVVAHLVAVSAWVYGPLLGASARPAGAVPA